MASPTLLSTPKQNIINCEYVNTTLSYLISQMTSPRVFVIGSFATLSHLPLLHSCVMIPCAGLHSKKWFRTLALTDYLAVVQASIVGMAAGDVGLAPLRDMIVVDSVVKMATTLWQFVSSENTIRHQYVRYVYIRGSND